MLSTRKILLSDSTSSATRSVWITGWGRAPWLRSPTNGIAKMAPAKMARRSCSSLHLVSKQKGKDSYETQFHLVFRDALFDFNCRFYAPWLWLLHRQTQGWHGRFSC